MASEKFSFRKRLKAFGYAREGVSVLIRDEHNFRIHLCATFLAILFGFLLEISQTEWCIVIMCIGIVLSAEAFNTAIEALADRITVENDSLIKTAKDVAAAGVTFVALMALIVGIIIYLPKIVALFL